MLYWVSLKCKCSHLPAVAERHNLVIKKYAWWLTLVTASVLAPARQRWRTTSRLPLLAAKCRGVLPYWIKERNTCKRNIQSIPGDIWLLYNSVNSQSCKHLAKMQVMQMLLRKIQNRWMDDLQYGTCLYLRIWRCDYWVCSLHL